MNRFPYRRSYPTAEGWTRVLTGLTHVTFALFLALTLLTPAWRAGVFTWLPIVRASMLGGREASLGALSLLPIVLVVCWGMRRWTERNSPAWRWGRLGIALPLAGLSLLVLISLDPSPTWRTIVQIGSVAWCWLILLFVVNEQPRLALPLSAVVVVHSLVAIAQFVVQRDLGLVELGEPVLKPTIEGVSVLVAQGQPWLRAYGLTGHPNALGALLAVLLLILLPLASKVAAWRRWLVMMSVMLGSVGLLLTFSRNAWLAFGGGLVILLFARRSSRQVRSSALPRLQRCFPTGIVLALAIVMFALLLGVTRDLIASRLFRLDIPVEATSLNERQRDARIAVTVIRQHPWRGIGAAHYPAVARQIDPDARTVHNVPLLVAAELGVPGVFLLFWLGLAPFSSFAGLEDGCPWYRRVRPRWPVGAAVASWGALLLLGMFDVSLWLTSSWQAAVLLGLVAGLQSQAEGELACA